MDNEAVAQKLEDIGDLLEIEGGVPFKVQAYHKAAHIIETLPQDIVQLVREGDLQKIPGVGKSIAEKIAEYVRTGHMAYYDELIERFPPGLVELISIPGVGPKRAKMVYEQLGVESVSELKAAAEDGRLRELKGLSAKIEGNILLGIEHMETAGRRLLLQHAYPIAGRIVGQLRGLPDVMDADMAGSLRRMKETIGDVDLLAASERPEAVMDAFVGLPEVDRVLAKGETKSSVLTTSGMQVDLRVVAPDQYGSALQYFTGSKEHSIKLRGIARERGLKINEYGVFDVATDRRLGGRTEEEVYAALGMDTPPPTLREDRGEIERAIARTLPNIIQLSDIKGDLQVHSKWSDGLDKIADIAAVAQSLGYEYFSMTDHAEKLYFAGGMTEKELRTQIEEIREVNEGLDGLRVLAGIELNIGGEGQVDFPASVLKDLDVVVAGIHSGFNQSREQLTRRMVAAMNNPYVAVIVHPTGRLLGKRMPYDLDMETVFKAARDTGTYLELNSYPSRLDLRDEYLQQGREEYGLRFSIGTDSHTAPGLNYMVFGVATAQRGWLTKDDIINTLPREELLAAVKRKRP